MATLGATEGPFQKPALALQALLAVANEGPAARHLVFDPTLARGLSYYTGPIFEITCAGLAGSMGGGGRYDNLTGVFGKPGLSGVGVSFGAERIYDLLEELNLFPAERPGGLRLLLLAFDEPTHRYAYRCLQQLRAAGINADLYPTPAKLQKQMKYANARQAPYVVLVGEEEAATGLLSLKNMTTGEQQRLSLTDLVAHIQA